MITRETALTTHLHFQMTEALREAIASPDTDSVTRAGAPLYLADLDRATIGEPIGDLIDVIEYFGWVDDDPDPA